MRQIFNPKLVMPTKCEDSALGVMLQEESLLSSVSKDYRPHDGSLAEPTDFRRLSNAFLAAKGNPGSAYNEHTCFEFHQLFVGTLLGCVRTLGAIADAMGNSKASEEVRGELAEQFLRHYRLLWRIANSHILTQHLMTLQEGSFLAFPTVDDVEAYHYYARIPLPNGSKKGAGDATDQLKEGNVGALQVDEEAEDAEDAEDVEDAEDDELREEKLNLVMHTSTRTGKARAVSRWTRNCVSHMDALSIVSPYYRSPVKGSSIEVNISLISAKSPPSRGTSISDWKSFIFQLAAPDNNTSKPAFDAEHAIKVIEACIKLEDFANCKIVQAFKTTASDGLNPETDALAVLFRGNIHCEAVVAFLTSPNLKNGISVAISKELLQLVEVHFTL
jgi:hypothetical protein